MERPIEFVDDKLILPEELTDWLKKGEKLVAYLEGDALILKRKRSAPLSRIAERGPNVAEWPLTDIAEEVHAYRKEKHRARGN